MLVFQKGQISPRLRIPRNEKISTDYDLPSVSGSRRGLECIEFSMVEIWLGHLKHRYVDPFFVNDAGDTQRDLLQRIRQHPIASNDLLDDLMSINRIVIGEGPIDANVLSDAKQYIYTISEKLGENFDFILIDRCKLYRENMDALTCGLCGHHPEIETNFIVYADNNYVVQQWMKICQRDTDQYLKILRND